LGRGLLSDRRPSVASRPSIPLRDGNGIFLEEKRDLDYTVERLSPSLEECAAFPHGAHDDQVDAMTQVFLRWHKAPEQTIVYYSEPVRISAF
jgi:hypothetical protein